LFLYLEVAQIILDLKCLWFGKTNFMTEEDSENHLIPQIAADHAQHYFKNLINLQLNERITTEGYENQALE
jgi:hypothetical protein